MATNFPTSLDALRANQGITDGTTIVTVAPHNNLMDAVDALEAKVGVNNSAVATSLDYKIKTFKGARLSGATVFSTHVTAANTWQDLSLAAVVGANAALVFLEVQASNVGACACKPKGYGGAFANHTGYTGNGAPSYGECGTAAGVAGFFQATDIRYLLCFTDSSGVIQIAYSDLTTTLTIKLIGYYR
jgi:hypothetical protein